jgi:tetratricopeptide (TPR) repeat protein
MMATLRLLICAVAVAMIATTSGCGGARARFTSHLQRGKAFLDSGNLDKAGVEFRNATQIEPKNPEALYFNGRVAEARSNIREAYGYYQAAIDADAGYDAARAGVGKMLIFAGGAKRALDVVATGLAAHPDNADLLAVRAAAHQQLKEPEAARADAERAVQLVPTNENAVAILAALYADATEYPRAIALASDAVARMPKSVDLREVLANLYLLSGQPEKAEGEMRKVIELEPMELAPRSQLAVHLVRGHNLEGAQRVLEDAVQAFSIGKQPSKADAAKLLLVDFIARERSREQGEKTLRDFIAREPDNSDLRLGLGALLQRTGATDEALKAYQEVAQRDGTGPKGLVARDRMAAIDVAAGHSQAARKLLTEVLQTNARDDDALILRATLEMQQNDPGSAIGDLRAVLRDRPDSIALERTLASAYLSNKQPALAEETARVALEQEPDNVDLLNLLGEMYFDRKEFKSAGDAFARASARNPQQPWVLRNLARVKLAVQDLDGAASEYQAALQVAPGEPQLVADAATFYETHGRVDEAIAAYEELYRQNPQAQMFAANNLAMLLVTYRKDPASLSRARDLTNGFATSDNGSLLDTLGWVRFKRGEYQQALTALERALQQAPDSRVIRFHLAMDQLQLGLREKARTNLESALNGADGFQGVEEARVALANLKVRA